MFNFSHIIQNNFINFPVLKDQEYGLVTLDDLISSFGVLHIKLDMNILSFDQFWRKHYRSLNLINHDDINLTHMWNEESIGNYSRADQTTVRYYENENSLIVPNYDGKYIKLFIAFIRH